MDYKKRYEIRHSKNERIGVPTGLIDCFGNEIRTGDYICFKNTGYDGIVLWHRENRCFGVFFGLWYKGQDPYNADCYGKFIAIPLDQGMRMELLPIKQSQATYDAAVLKRVLSNRKGVH